ncbi:MAG: hypothetical protein L6Q46_01065 [Flavobacterium sp.]|uniref:hypothetical protein n=1 Tax=Flavobacterium sp. TaxID=239 RepID=UPI0025C4C22E|nr:hypothetical protein [Flavobacterium sp.]MCK6606874.1 hypothetical protein [Flavobacterium sp.]
MMEPINKIKFPLLDLTIDNWSKIKDVSEILFDDEFIYSSSNSNFKLFLLNHLLVDDNGNLFKIKSKEDLPLIKRLLPFGRKAKLIFEDLNKTIDFEEVKVIVLSNINNLEVNDLNKDFINKWYSKVLISKSLSEMFWE